MLFRENHTKRPKTQSYCFVIMFANCKILVHRQCKMKKKLSVFTAAINRKKRKLPKFLLPKNINTH